MEKSNEISSVRGTFDITPNEYYIYNSINENLKKCFESYGYKGIVVPIIEYSELHLRKSGDEIISKMYEFKDYGNRKICLRPELTASVARAYLNNLMSESLPIRLYYSGPSFRYDKPQKGRYRQFTQAGIELIGSNSEISDAEIIWIANKGLCSLGLKKYSLIIGHIGLVLDFLENSGLDERVKRMLLKNMELLSKGGTVQKIRSHFEELDIITKDIAKNENKKYLTDFLKYLEEIDYSKAKKIIYGLLEEIGLGIDGNRVPEEVAERLLFKIKRKNQRKNIDKALEFIKELIKIKGNPKIVFSQINDLIREYNLSKKPLEELETVIENLDYFNIDWGKVNIDLGFGRGLDYYTGIIFEINYDGLGTQEKQICGGGRYNDLIRILGGKRDLPSLGFAYGIERIKLALEIEKKFPENLKNKVTDMFIIPIGNEVLDYVIKVSELLREIGFNVEIDVLERKINRNLEYVDKMNIPFAVIIGGDEKKSKIIKLRNTKTKLEQIIPLEHLKDKNIMSNLS